MTRPCNFKLKGKTSVVAKYYQFPENIKCLMDQNNTCQAQYNQLSIHANNGYGINLNNDLFITAIFMQYYLPLSSLLGSLKNYARITLISLQKLFTGTNRCISTYTYLLGHAGTPILKTKQTKSLHSEKNMFFIAFKLINQNSLNTKCLN